MANPNIPKTLLELTIDKLIAGYGCSKASLDEVRALSKELSKDELKSLVEKRLDIVYLGSERFFSVLGVLDELN